MGAVSRAGQRNPKGYAVPGTLPTIGGVARTPNASRPTQVVAVIRCVLSNGQSGQVNVLTSPNQTTALAQLADAGSAINVTGLGVSVADTRDYPLTFEVPANGRYQFTTTGTGTFTIQSIFEQTL